MAQPVFQDPQVVSITPDPGNTGDGVLTVTKLTHFTIDQTYTITAIQTTPDAVFSVVGDVDGGVGLATENVEFKDEDLKIFFLITPGATPFAIGDQFTVVVQQGTDLNQDNIDTYDELPQKNFSDDNDDNLRYDDVEKTYSFNVDEVTDPGNFFEGNGLVQARDFLTHQADTYEYDVLSSQKETSDETLFRKLLKITDNEPEDTAVNVSGASITRADGTTFKLLNKNGATINFSGGTIDFATGTGTNTVAFTPATLAPNEYVQYGISINNEDPAELFVTPGTPNAVLANLEEPTFPSGFSKIGIVTVQDDGSGGVGNILDIGRDDIIQFSVSNEGTEDQGVIQDILVLKYAARIDDRLEDKDAFNDTNTTGAFSSGAYNLDYSNRVITVAANNVTVGAAPSFTVVVGDVIRQGTEHTVITNVNSQTDFDVVDGSVLTTATNATISQKAETISLPLFGDPIEKTRSRDFIQTNIEQVLVWYEDDVYQDTPNSPNVAFSLTTNGTFFTNVDTRPNDFTDVHEATLIDSGNAGNDLIIRFFSNTTSGDGTVRLETYRAYYHLRTPGGQSVGTEIITEIVASGLNAKNNSGGLIPRLRVVRPDATMTSERNIVAADKASFATGVGIGVTSEDMVDQQEALIVTAGLIEGGGTDLGLDHGDEVFLGAAGAIVDTAPATPGEYILRVGMIVGDDLYVAIENRGVV